jgi:hypothetical protein
MQKMQIDNPLQLYYPLAGGEKEDAKYIHLFCTGPQRLVMVRPWPGASGMLHAKGGRRGSEL